MILYKHMGINDNSLSSIREKYIWFSSPSAFNDPYGCRARLRNIDRNEVEEIYTIYPQYRLIEELDKVLYPLLEEFLKKYVSELGVASFTKKRDSILMWSHYSNQHKGICLGFRESKINLGYYSPLLENKYCDLKPNEVVYDDKYPEINLSLNREPHLKEVKKLLTTKASDWRYEEEIRYISFENKRHYFNKESLVEVIFGVNVDRMKQIEIVDTIRSSGYPNVQFYNCELNSTKYSLNIIPYSN